jgi:uncharacterized membrane protein YdjX (TVP38/TMEM64 family)
MSKSFIKKNWGVFATLLLILFLAVIWKSIPFETLLTVVEDNILSVVLMYIFLHFIADVFAPIGSSPLFIAGFYLMGDWVYLAEIINAIIASAVNFYIARRWGYRFLNFLLSDKGMERVQKITEVLNNMPLIPLRIFTMPFNSYAAYAYGFTKVNFTKYFLMSIFSTLVWFGGWKFILADTIINVGVFFVWFYVLTLPFIFFSWVASRKIKKQKQEIAHKK